MSAATDGRQRSVEHDRKQHTYVPNTDSQPSTPLSLGPHDRGAVGSVNIKSALLYNVQLGLTLMRLVSNVIYSIVSPHCFPFFDFCMHFVLMFLIPPLSWSGNDHCSLLVRTGSSGRGPGRAGRSSRPES